MGLEARKHKLIAELMKIENNHKLEQLESFVKVLTTETVDEAAEVTPLITDYVEETPASERLLKTNYFTTTEELKKQLRRWQS